MEVFTRFLYAFLSQVFLGFSTMLKGIGTGIKQLFDIKTYQDVLQAIKDKNKKQPLTVWLFFYCMQFFL